MPRKLDGSYIQTGSITTTQLSSQVTQVIEAGGGPRVTSLVYPGDDLAANTVGGQTVYIVGSGFETNNAIYINGSAVPAKSFISASNLSFTTPALSEGIYPVYVINTDTGATAIYVPGLTVSNEPTWISSAAIEATETWEISLSATGDGQITYALANGSSLPGGISLAANGLISGTMTSPPETDTQYTFTVVASDAQNQDSSRQFTVTVSLGEGALFANNVLLIHSDGTNNQNNHTFLDSSSNGFTITRNGNPTQGSFSPFSQTGWSVYFGSSTSNLILPSNSSFAIAAGNFTIEGFVNFTAWSGTNQRIFLQGVNGTDGIALYRNSGANNLIVGINNTEVISYSWSPVLGKWYHLAVVRSGTGSNQVALYIDGVSVATGTANASVAQNQFIIGGLNWASSYNMQGYISNVRYSNNARTVVVPTSAYTSDANTIALACQSNRFVDNSNNNLSITVNGTTSVVPFSPFAPTAAYSAANVGGSGYFDGSGDYLSAALTGQAPGTGDFTYELWVYPLSNSFSGTLFNTRSNENSGSDGFDLNISNSSVQCTYTNVVWYNQSSTAVRPYSWNHLAVVRNNGSVSVYVNGVSLGSTSQTSNFSSTILFLMANVNTTTPFPGYTSGFRYTKSAVYTTNFTPPTAPPTNIANTSALLNFTNAGIFDQTAKQVIETVGDAKVSTAQYKYGTGSVYFDGTGDYLVAPYSNLMVFPNDFTVEFWMHPTAYSSPGNMIICQGGSNNTDVNGWSIQFGSSFISFITRHTAPPDSASSSSAPALNTWTHIAAVRYNGVIKIYVNGTAGSTTDTTTGTITNSTYPLYIGRSALQDYWGSYQGYLDDIRISNYARYTSNFTPPSSAHKDK